MREATKEAIPQTMMVALVRLDPVPPPDEPSGIARCCAFETAPMNVVEHKDQGPRVL